MGLLLVSDQFCGGLMFLTRWTMGRGSCTVSKEHESKLKFIGRNAKHATCSTQNKQTTGGRGWGLPPQPVLLRTCNTVVLLSV